MASTIVQNKIDGVWSSKTAEYIQKYGTQENINNYKIAQIINLINQPLNLKTLMKKDAIILPANLIKPTQAMKDELKEIIDTCINNNEPWTLVTDEVIERFGTKEQKQSWHYKCILTSLPITEKEAQDKNTEGLIDSVRHNIMNLRGRPDLYREFIGEVSLRELASKMRHVAATYVNDTVAPPVVTGVPSYVKNEGVKIAENILQAESISEKLYKFVMSQTPPEYHAVSRENIANKKRRFDLANDLNETVRKFEQQFKQDPKKALNYFNVPVPRENIDLFYSHYKRPIMALCKQYVLSTDYKASADFIAVIDKVSDVIIDQSAEVVDSEVVHQEIRGCLMEGAELQKLKDLKLDYEKLMDVFDPNETFKNSLWDKTNALFLNYKNLVDRNFKWDNVKSESDLNILEVTKKADKIIQYFEERLGANADMTDSVGVVMGGFKRLVVEHLQLLAERHRKIAEQKRQAEPSQSPQLRSGSAISHLPSPHQPEASFCSEIINKLRKHLDEKADKFFIDCDAKKIEFKGSYEERFIERDQELKKNPNTARDLRRDNALFEIYKMAKLGDDAALIRLINEVEKHYSGILYVNLKIQTSNMPPEDQRFGRFVDMLKNKGLSWAETHPHLAISKDEEAAEGRYVYVPKKIKATAPK